MDVMEHRESGMGNDFRTQMMMTFSNFLYQILIGLQDTNMKKGIVMIEKKKQKNMKNKFKNRETIGDLNDGKRIYDCRRIC